MKRHVGRVARVVAVIVVLLALAPARTVLAHASLVASSPAANSVLDSAPKEIVLDFDEAVEGSAATVHLYRGNGQQVPLDDPQSASDNSVVTVDVPDLADDLYAVVWRVPSADGHVVEGAFSFQIGDTTRGDGDALVASVRGGVQASDAVRWGAGLARTLGYIALVVVLGCGWWWSVSARGGADGPAARAMRRWVPIGASVGALAACMSFVFYAADAVAGSLADAFSPSVWDAVADTRAGTLLKARIGLSLALVAIAVSGDRLPSRWRRVTEGVLGAALVLTFSAFGHPSALAGAALWVALDAVHMVAMTAWLGGVVVLATLPRESLTADPALAVRFSRVALAALPVVVITGMANAWKIGDLGTVGVSALTDTDWGRGLLWKIGVVIVVLCIAATARTLLRRRGSGSLRALVRTEALLGVVVLALAAGIVTRPPEPAAINATPFAVQLAAPDGLIAVVSLSPGAVGSNEVHIFLTPPGGSIIPILDVTARVSLADQPNSPVTLRKEGPNHFQGTLTFPSSGQWELELIVQVREGQQDLLRTTVPVP